MSEWTETVKAKVASAIKFGIDGNGAGFNMANARVFGAGEYIFTPFEMKLDHWMGKMTEYMDRMFFGNKMEEAIE